VSHSPVADDIVGVEVEGGEGDDLTAQGQGAGHLSHAQLTLKLKQETTNLKPVFGQSCETVNNQSQPFFLARVVKQ
jgi:hypothetical protein